MSNNPRRGGGGGGGNAHFKKNQHYSHHYQNQRNTYPEEKNEERWERDTFRKQEEVLWDEDFSKKKFDLGRIIERDPKDENV